MLPNSMTSWNIFGTVYHLLSFFPESSLYIHFGMLWKQRGILTSSGQKIKRSTYDLELLQAIKLPKSLAILKFPGHS